MNGLIVAAGSVGLVLLVGLVAAIFWLSKARKAQAVAETKTDALEGALELKHEGDKIMAEPVADESAWIADWARRLREAERRKP